MRTAGYILHESPQADTRFLGHYGFVGFDHIDKGSGGAQLVWDHVARNFCAYQGDALAADLIA